MQKTDSGQSASSSSISLPSGGGAVKGMGESFSPDLFTGTGNFSVPIALPAGRNGFQPELTLVYSSGNGNGAFGLGWNLSVPGVTRKTSRGIPLYDEQNDVFLLSGAEDLVETSRDLSTPGQPGVITYRPRTEGLFARIERHVDASNDYWKVWSKDGLVSYYGTPNSINTVDQYNDPATIANPEYKSNVFEWKLSKTEDVFGNVILYSYLRTDRAAGAFNSDPHNWDMLYLSEIHYADYFESSLRKFLCSVKFIYQNRPDAFSSYRSGFEMRHTLRCDRIALYTHPDDTDVLTKTYDLIYLNDRVAAGQLDKKALPHNGSSILSQVKITGYDGEASESMPPLEFGYTTFNPVRRDFDPVRGKELPPLALGEGQYDLIDLSGNGLPDIVELGGVLPRYWRNLGNGTFDMPRTMNQAPVGIRLDDPEVSLADANGDGRPDLMVNKIGMNGYFSLGFNGEWDKKVFQRQAFAPTFSLNDPEVRMLDLDGDGITDVLRNGSRFECFFNDAEEGFYKTSTVDKKTIDKFPNISFSDPRLRFADMTGDGMQDMVMIHNGSIEYWPNLGHGRWGSRVVMKNAPRFPFQYNNERIIIGDIDGDGCSDLLFVDDHKVTLWINQNGEGWSEGVTITGTPSARDMKGVRLADLCGWGTASLVWSYSYDGTSKDRMFWLDFNGAVKPYVLNTMNNHMGAITQVEYRSSTYYYLSDREGYDPLDPHNPFLPENRIRMSRGRELKPTGTPKRVAKKPWKTNLPFPVQVVAQTQVMDELSKGKLLTQYAYHHGYWDGGEREFRGFGNVEQKDTETFERYNQGKTVDFNKVNKIQYAPPILTKNWFHLGPIGDQYGDWNEIDFSAEYWSQDPNVLQRPDSMKALFKSLPRRARRDAYRTLRGSALRTEVYALDGTARQNRPYTVTENLQGVRLEYAPPTFQKGLLAENPFVAQGLLTGSFSNEVLAENSFSTNKQGSGYIFFSFGLASRSSQWERGEEPMSSFSFSEDYDQYGLARKQIAVAVPRGKNPLGSTVSGGAYLATYAESTFAHRNDSNHYLIGRTISNATFEFVNQGNTSVFKLKDNILAITQTQSFPYEPLTTDYCLLTTHTISYYDGTAFTGLSYGQLGDYGVAVRSETLAFSQEQLEDIYDTDKPVYINTDGGTVADWPSEYSEGFKDHLPDNAGYVYYLGNDNIHLQGYYCESSRTKFDFHDSPSTAKGLPLQSKDPLDNLTSISYDSYTLFPTTVTDALGMETQAEYDYRVMQAKQVTDANENRSQVAFSPLGFVIKTALMGKSSESIGDTLDNPGTLMEYDFFAFYNSKQPVFVKSTVHEGHYNASTTGGDYNKTIVSVQYSDGFGRLIQSRAQAEEVIFGDQLFGDAGLAATTVESDDNALGVENTDTENLNVIVSGWQVYDNKGRVVEKYEPYYDKGFDYKGLETPTQKTLFLSTQGLVAFPDQEHYHVGTSNFSIEAWIKADEVFNYSTVLANQTVTSGNLIGFDLFIFNEQICLNIADGTGNVQSLAPFTGRQGVWTHLVVQRIGNDAGDFKVYLNGVEQTVSGGTGLSTGDINSLAVSSMNIGGRSGFGVSSDYFKGAVQQVRLYERLCSEPEITAAYQAGRYASPINTSNLLLWASMEKGNGTKVYDLSTYNALGTINGTGIYFDYEGFAAFKAFSRAQKVQLFYDPRGQVIRTVNPDQTEQRVLFGIPLSLDNPNVFTPTPWESYTYDANDLAELTHPSATTVPTDHHYTPSNSIIDALGRTVKTIDRNFKDAVVEEILMQYAFDIRGNLLQVKDPYNRTVFEHRYDLLNRPLKTTHIDAGTKLMVMDAMSKPIEARDAKGSLVLNSYDELNRPTKVWCRDTSAEATTLRHETLYGDSAGLTDPQDLNLKGKPYQAYDEAGRTTFTAYDFKGNPLEKTRQVIADEQILAVFDGPPTDWAVETYRVDWDTDTDSILDAQEFTTTIEYDALNRVTKITYPEDVETERKELIPSYNKSGALESVLMDGDTYVERIAYNARGQRILLATGNGVMTRYKYRTDNFRLLRMKSEKYSKSDDVTYVKESGTIRQNYSYTYDLAGNIVSIKNEVTGCGVAGTDELEREFEYDALYRLLSASGRENAPTATFPWDDTYRPANNGATRAYTQHYDYDKLGNIQSLQHVATGGNFTREFSYITDTNKLEKIEIGSDDYDFTHDVNGNILSEGDVSRHLEYDYADRLRAFYIQTGTAEPSKHAHYLYDAGGNRVKKILRLQGGGYKTTVYIDGMFEYTKDSAYSEAIPDLEVSVWTIGASSTGEQNILHIMDGNSRIATRRLGDDLGDVTPEIKFNLEDHLGSSNLSLSTDGAVVSGEEYYPFGETSFGSYGKKRYRFCGKERDEESGLYYYGMRYYSAWTCRFISIDPLAAKYPFYSPYQYAGNMPINSVDIDGLEPDSTSTTPQTPTDSTSTQSNPVPVSQDSTTTENIDTSLVAPQDSSSTDSDSTGIFSNNTSKRIGTTDENALTTGDEVVITPDSNKSSNKTATKEDLPWYQKAWNWVKDLFSSNNNATTEESTAEDSNNEIEKTQGGGTKVQKDIITTGTPMLSESKYQPIPDETYCNIYCQDLAKEVLDTNPFKDPTDEAKWGINSAGMQSYVEAHPELWKKTSLEDAWKEINAGAFVVFFCPGHVATGAPTKQSEMTTREIKGNSYTFGNIIQAGRSVGHFPLNQGIGKGKIPTLGIYMYIGPLNRK